MTEILEPLKAYKEIREKFSENVLKYFDELTLESGVDVDKNIAKVNEIKRLVTDAKGLHDTTENVLGSRALLLFLGIFATAMGVFAFIVEKNAIWIPILILTLALIMDVIFGFVIVKKINPKLREINTLKRDVNGKLDTLRNETLEEMAPLNNLYPDDIADKLINESQTFIRIDDSLSPNTIKVLERHYGYTAKHASNISQFSLKTGSFLNNPFLMMKDKEQEMQEKTYSNSIVISWHDQVHEMNAEGKMETRTVLKQETLTASVVRPVPVYGYNDYLLFASNVAPNLSFSRSPSKLIRDGYDEGDIKHYSKALDKKARKALTDDNPETNYQRLGHDEFEVLFGGTNRDNELEYRLMFTPLARRNLLELIKAKEPFGDDFYMIKRKKLTYIKTLHDKDFKYDLNKDSFIDFSYERARVNFLKLNQEYFDNFYFKLAPIISIPLYHEGEKYEETALNNVSLIEAEVIANKLGAGIGHPDGVTDIIINASFIKKMGDFDLVRITANNFKAIKKCSIESKLGGDGRFHTIPVDYLEYLPVERESEMLFFNVTKEEEARLKDPSLNARINDFSAKMVIHKGIVGILLKRAINDGDLKLLKL